MCPRPPHDRPYRPGCPDPMWCSGNNICYWHCLQDEDGNCPTVGGQLQARGDDRSRLGGNPDPTAN